MIGGAIVHAVLPRDPGRQAGQQRAMHPSAAARHVMVRPTCLYNVVSICLSSSGSDCWKLMGALTASTLAGVIREP